MVRFFGLDLEIPWTQKTTQNQQGLLLRFLGFFFISVLEQYNDYFPPISFIASLMCFVQDQIITCPVLLLRYVARA